MSNKYIKVCVNDTATFYIIYLSKTNNINMLLSVELTANTMIKGQKRAQLIL